MQYHRYERDMFPQLKELVEAHPLSLLDVGCGLCLRVGSFSVRTVIGIDAHRPYLENRVDRSPHIIPLHMDASLMDRYFMPKSISTVLFNDSIEHFEKNKAIRLLKSAEQIAVNRVVIFTPRGFFRQKKFDYFQMNGESYQEHRSGWEPEELNALGYQVCIYHGLHGPENMSFLQAYGADHPRIDALLAWKDV